MFSGVIDFVTSFLTPNPIRRKRKLETTKSSSLYFEPVRTEYSPSAKRQKMNDNTYQQSTSSSTPSAYATNKPKLTETSKELLKVLRDESDGVKHKVPLRKSNQRRHKLRTPVVKSSVSTNRVSARKQDDTKLPDNVADTAVSKLTQQQVQYPTILHTSQLKKDDEYYDSIIHDEKILLSSNVDDDTSRIENLKQQYSYDSKLAQKAEAVERLREMIMMFQLNREMGVEKQARYVTARLITEVTDELAEEIAEQTIYQELPNFVFNKILSELIEEELTTEKEFLELTENDEDTVEWVLNWKNRNKVIVDKFNIDMTGEKLGCLSPAQWLNDEVINFYFNMCMERAARYPGRYPKCHFFNTFFYAKLTQRDVYSYSNVRRWTKSIDLFSLDKVIIPVHLGVHWVLSVINIRDQQFEYYDSMIGSTATGESVIRNLRRYIEDEHKDKKKTPLNTSDWAEIIGSRHNTPQQANGFDCGMFTCKFANWVSQDKDFTFSQKNMNYFRKRMIIEIKRSFVL